MSLSSVCLASFLVVFGVITAFAVTFKYALLVLGGLAIAAGVAMFARR